MHNTGKQRYLMGVSRGVEGHRANDKARLGFLFISSFEDWNNG